MSDTKRIEKKLSIDELVDILKKSEKFKEDEISIAATREGIFVRNYTSFCYLVRKLNEHVATETLPGGGIPTVRVSFYREKRTVYSYQTHNEGIPNL